MTTVAGPAEVKRRGTQRDLVRSMLQRYGSVSVHELVYEHGITRSAAIIHTLRHEEGMLIVTRNRDSGPLAEYELVPPGQLPCRMCDRLIPEVEAFPAYFSDAHRFVRCPDCKVSTLYPAASTP